LLQKERGTSLNGRTPFPPEAPEFAILWSRASISGSRNSVADTRKMRMSPFQVRAAVGPLLAGAVVWGLGCNERRATDGPGRAGWVATEEPKQALPLPFVVDDHFHPSNCFDEPQNCSTVVFDSKGCGPGGVLRPGEIARPEGAQGQCYGYVYKPTSPSGFGGVLSTHHPKGGANWGDVEGRPIEPGARKVTFYAAAPDGRLPTVYFKVGGIQDATLPYQDTLKLERPIVLGPEFQKYEISLEGQAYDKVIAAFGWTMLASDGVGPFKFFVDDVRWE
jgi:hypothetical protein